MYPFCLYASKLAFLFLYLRIFTSDTFDIFRRFIYGTIAFTLAAGLSCAIVSLFQCLPVSYAWTSWDGEHHGHCADMNAQAYANASITIALDVWIIGLPLSQITRLTWSWKKKGQAILMFSVGFLYSLLSPLRNTIVLTNTQASRSCPLYV